MAQAPGSDGLISLADFGPAFYLLPLFTLVSFLVPIFYLFPPVPVTKSSFLGESHIRLGLRGDDGGLGAQSSPKQPKDADPETSRKPSLCSLWIYPVKSCGGIEVSRSRVLPTGLEFDRLYTFAQLRSNSTSPQEAAREIITSDVWEFITQRQFALLANVKVDIWIPDPARRPSITSSSGAKQEAQNQEQHQQHQPWIVMRFPWRDRGLRGFLQRAGAVMAGGWDAVPEKEILMPVSFPAQEDIRERGYTYEEVKIWRDVVRALNMGVELPEELRLYLGVSGRLGLFRIDPSGLREVYRCAPRKEEAGYQPIVGFQDAYPLHMMNLSSLHDFDSMVTKDPDLKQLDVRRFRSNIIISGAPAYDEETWKSIRFTPGTSSLTKGADFHVSCRTVRCKLPNVDPDNGTRHRSEPDRSLRKHRNVDSGAPLLGCLGMQMCPMFEEAGSVDSGELYSWVEVGMTVNVLRRGEHVYIKQ